MQCHACKQAGPYIGTKPYQAGEDCGATNNTTLFRPIAPAQKLTAGKSKAAGRLDESDSEFVTNAIPDSTITDFIVASPVFNRISQVVHGWG